MPARPVAFRARANPGAATAAQVAGHARALGVLGWVRVDPDEPARLLVHVEGDTDAVEQLLAFAAAQRTERVAVEGHEQFAVRGVSAGAFVVAEHRATAHHYDLRLELDGVMRSWALPRGPSMDPAIKRLAVQVQDHDPARPDVEGASKIIWDRGSYEQGGRVPWPEALDRGHAVFVLHGDKLRGGFALQRTRARSGAPAQWLMIKRRDDRARPGSDVTAAQPRSVISGRTLG
ncbi:MAG: DNA polymerase ligase N-terminal domain-containing protein [Solirubrobacteraceae bacterium]